MNMSQISRRAGAGLAGLGALALLVSGPSARAQNAGGGAGKGVTINIQNAPVQAVLRSLFSSAGKNFSISPGVSGTVTVDVNQVPFDTALQAVLGGASPPLVAPLTNGIYQVQVDVPPAAPTPVNLAPVAGTATATGDTPTTKDDPHHAYKIPVSHYDAAYMSYLIAAFSRKGGPPIIVPSDPNAPQNGNGNNGNSNGNNNNGNNNNRNGNNSGGNSGGFGGGGFGGNSGGGFGGNSGGGFGGNSGGFGGGGFGGNNGGGFGGY